MEAEKCEGCFYFTNGQVGDCRRNAPVAMISKSPLGATGIKTVWPTVRSNDWCGEFTAATIEN